MKHLFRFLPIFLFVLCCPWAKAQTDSVRAVRYTHLFGIGGVNLLDTYLSPLEYTGWQASTMHTTERPLRPTSRWYLSARYGGDLARALSPTEDGKYWDANLYAAVQLRRQWKPLTALTLQGGAMGEVFLGGTYSQRNGNNPAQGRIGAQIGLSGQAAYAFRLWNKPWRALISLDVPLLGLAFTPAYGQSYYEIFELDHRDRNVRCTYLGNAPSLLLTANLEIPLGGSALVVGYQADVRQHKLAGLKRHSWGNRFVIGWTRRLQILRNR